MDSEKILSLTAESGIESVVLGSLRVTERILANLGAAALIWERLKGG